MKARLRHALVALTTVTLTFSGVAAAPAADTRSDAADAAGRLGNVAVRLRQAVRDLPVAAETRVGYDRDAFRLWTDADGDCRDTRDEVLAAESLVAVHGCDVQAGRWRSYYDGAVTRDSTDFDIDHLVALAEAWDSGARRWTAGTRERFANDLGDRRSLVAVSASSNRSKSDQDPREWMPRLGRCTYVTQWVAVKLRWRLKVDAAEKRSLTRKAGDCANRVIKVRRASVRTGTAGGGGGGGGGTTDPRFSTCGEAIAHGYGPYYRNRDPEYGWYTDADGDGIVCES